MKEFENLIDEMLKWGTELKDQPKDNLVTLEKQLITLYTFYLDCPEMSDNDEYPDPPPFPEKEYQEVIKKTFLILAIIVWF